MSTQEAVESLRSRHNRLQELSQSAQPAHIMRGIMAELHAQAIGIDSLNARLSNNVAVIQQKNCVVVEKS